MLPVYLHRLNTTTLIAMTVNQDLEQHTTIHGGK
jgi:hypothetical protein